MVKAFLEDHDQFTPRECRELLGLWGVGFGASRDIEVFAAVVCRVRISGAPGKRSLHTIRATRET
jgi:hypothetical protein